MYDDAEYGDEYDDESDNETQAQLEEAQIREAQIQSMADYKRH